MEKNNITFDLVKIISSETTEEFIKQIEHILHKHDIYAFRIWDVRGNVCEPCSYIPSDLYATFDIYELGFKNEDFSSNINIDISYFGLELTFTVFAVVDLFSSSVFPCNLKLNVGVISVSFDAPPTLTINNRVCLPGTD